MHFSNKLRSFYQSLRLLTLFLLKSCYSIFVQVRRYVVHTLVGGGGQHGGFNALDYRKIKHGDAGKLGNYHILVLPDNCTRTHVRIHSFCVRLQWSWSCGQARLHVLGCPGFEFNQQQ
jgi:hypothetical protein